MLVEAVARALADPVDLLSGESARVLARGVGVRSRPRRRLGLMPTMSASLPGERAARLPPPPTRIGGRGCCTGFGQRVVGADRVVLADEVERARRSSTRLTTAIASPRRSIRVPRRVVGEIERGVVGRHPAGAEAELEATLGQHVERRRFLGDDRRMLVVVAEHEHADPQRVGDRGRERRARPSARAPCPRSDRA